MAYLASAVKVWVHIVHVNFNLPLKLQPKVGLCILHESILCSRFYCLSKALD